jgi:hypothetical protein
MPIARQRLGKHIPDVTLSTIEVHPLPGNRPINMHSWQQKTVFSVGSMPKNYKRAESEEFKEYERVQGSNGVQRSTREYNRVVKFSSVGSQNTSNGMSSRRIWQCFRLWFVNCCNQLYKGPVNSIIWKIPIFGARIFIPTELWLSAIHLTIRAITRRTSMHGH